MSEWEFIRSSLDHCAVCIKIWNCKHFVPSALCRVIYSNVGIVILDYVVRQSTKAHVKCCYG
jgi:hypothetical protein